jgi:SAM-dependent methyltransferase
MKPKTKRLLKGLASFVPGTTRLVAPRSGGTNSARYCYSVWLRHLSLAREQGLCESAPAVVAELGPGDSIGTGLAALLSGSEQYYGLDVVDYVPHERSAAIFEELVQLYRARAPIPGPEEFPEAKPPLGSYEFPAFLQADERHRQALQDDRVAAIRKAVGSRGRLSSGPVRYAAPWQNGSLIAPGALGMIFSQAVMEHVDGLDEAYRAMHRYLKPGGFMSHQIDFRSHGTADEWNGHWTYQDWQWALFRGRRDFLINREPLSTHLGLIESAGFRIHLVKPVESPSRLTSAHLAPRFRNLTTADLSTSGAFIQAVKP